MTNDERIKEIEERFAKATLGPGIYGDVAYLLTALKQVISTDVRLEESMARETLLRSQRQNDADGVTISVSREALCDFVGQYDRLWTALKQARAELAGERRAIKDCGCEDALKAQTELTKARAEFGEIREALRRVWLGCRTSDLSDSTKEMALNALHIANPSTREEFT